MKPNIMVYLVLAFGLIVSFVVPHLFNIDFSGERVYQSSKKEELAGTSKTLDKSDEVKKASNVDLAIATPIVAEKKVVKTNESSIKKPTPVVAEADTSAAIVFDNLTFEQLSAKLNRTLKSNLSGTGNLYAKYSLEYGVDPYLATAITLHETGCNWSCSAAVKNKNNVGGMMGKGGLIHFNSLDDGIRSFIKNLKEKYYNYGLNTPELMNKKYASNPNWHIKINSYINKIKQA